MATVLTQRASIGCGHGGTVKVVAGQGTLTAGGAAVLVVGDLTGKPIAGCLTPSVAGSTLPCTAVVSVTGGTATTLTADGRAVLTDTVSGQTNGNPVGTLTVLSPGQQTLRAS